MIYWLPRAVLASSIFSFPLHLSISFTLLLIPFRFSNPLVLSPSLSFSVSQTNTFFLILLASLIVLTLLISPRSISLYISLALYISLYLYLSIYLYICLSIRPTRSHMHLIPRSPYIPRLFQLFSIISLTSLSILFLFLLTPLHLHEMHPMNPSCHCFHRTRSRSRSALEKCVGSEVSMGGKAGVVKACVERIREMR